MGNWPGVQIQVVWGVVLLMDEKLNMTQPCALTAQRAKHVLGCIQSSMASRAKEGILLLYSTPMRSHTDYCIQLWSPQHRKDMDPWNGSKGGP